MPRIRKRIALFGDTLVFSGMSVCAVLLFGLLWFVDLIPRETITPDQGADAVVVLTGGAKRFTTGLKLLESGKVPHLLLTGVSDGIDAAELQRVNAAKPELMMCCVTLGHEAFDTTGNALEAKKWTGENNIQSFYLVTANYHMPRALLEFKASMPSTKIIPYPIVPDNFNVARWWKSFGSLRIVMNEYVKYMGSRLRIFLIQE